LALITAAWTLASVRRLGQAGAGSATYFETVGWRGVLESDPPEPRDASFPAAPGMLFPVYHLLAELAPLSGLEMLECNSSHPLELEAIHIAAAGEVLLLVANLTPRAARAKLEPIGVDPEICRLNGDTVRRHVDTGGARECWSQLRGGDGGTVELALSPFEVSFLRWRAVGDPAAA
jgi:D-apionolactonase